MAKTSSKRDPALIPLSHDHHHALVIAMLLRRATGETASGTRQAYLDFWRHECAGHFHVEEQVLFPAHAEVAGADDPLLARALADHAEIRALTAALADTSGPTGAQLVELGDTLSAHVRLEERELFPAIENELTDEQLIRLGERITEAERITVALDSPSSDDDRRSDG
ncbi:MAG: hemerythrin domain-containing protein [Actinobacteria bacterium]|nr:hemerythrin domain-containing protein [Actinomycetota bacterium]